MAGRADPVSRAPRGPWQFGLGTAAVGLALATVESAWFRRFLTWTLPNSGYKELSRSVLLWQALPGVIPNFPPNRAHLVAALRELSHVENLPQRAPLVLAAALIVAAALALGGLILRALGLARALDPRERVPLGFGLGTVALGLLTLLAGRLGLIAPWPTRLGLGLIVAVGLAAWSRRPKVDEEPQPPIPNLVPPSPTWPFLLIMILGAMLPSYDYDAIEYHLEGPKEYFLAGRIAFLPHNVYTSMPFGVEMLHLLGMEVVGDWWWGALVGQLLVSLFAPAAAAMIALTARRWGSPRAAWVAAVVYLTTPWVYRLAVIPYVEGPLCYFHAALVWAAGRAWGAEPIAKPRWWGLAGLLAGGAMACKYPGLVSAVIPVGTVALADALRGRSRWAVPAFALGVAAAIGPWLARNVVDTGNPVYPLAFKVFGGGYWDDELDRKWQAAHGPRTDRSPGALEANLLDVAGRSDWQSPLYAALAPLALLRPGSRRVALALWAYVAYIFLTWWLLTHRLDRFWLPLLPAAAVLAGLGADWARHLGWTILLAAILAVGWSSNLVYTSTSLAGFNEWTGDLAELRSRVPRSLNPSLARLDEELGTSARILLVGQAAVFHLRHPIVYNTVFNRESFEVIARDRTPDEVRRDLGARGVDFVYVDWNEIRRFRSPGNYGFTDFVTPAAFARLVAAGVLGPPRQVGLGQELYRVRPTPAAGPR